MARQVCSNEYRFTLACARAGVSLNVALHHEQSDGVLARVVVDGPAAVLHVSRELLPLRRRVVQRRAQRALRQRRILMQLHEPELMLHQRRQPVMLFLKSRLGTASTATLFGRVRLDRHAPAAGFLHVRLPAGHVDPTRHCLLLEWVMEQEHG